MNKIKLIKIILSLLALCPAVYFCFIITGTSLLQIKGAIGLYIALSFLSCLIIYIWFVYEALKNE